MTLFDNISTTSYMPRDYQHGALESVGRNYDLGQRRNMVVMATGLGKSVFMSFLPHYHPDLAKSGMLVMVHRKELVEQLARTIQDVNPSLYVQMEMAERRALREADVVVASIQSLASDWRLDKFTNRFGIVVVDECHHCSPKSQYEKVLRHFGLFGEDRFTLPNGQERLLVGVTATPNRHDKQGLHHFFDDIPVNYDILWGIKNGFLCDIQAYQVEGCADLKNVKTRTGDFAADELAQAVNTEERNHLVVTKGYLEHDCGRSLAFCTSIQHAVDLAEVFRAQGVKAQAVHSKMEQTEREYWIDAYKGGDLDVLCNMGILTEGFDAPHTKSIIMARPTQSTSLYLQMLGRGTRPFPAPKGLTVMDRLAEIAQSSKPFMQVIDFTDNLGKHQIVSAPKLFGLPAQFKTPAKKNITDILEQIEELEYAHPEKNFREAQSLEEIEIISKKIGIWDIARSPESLKSITEYNWFESGEGNYKITIPREGTSDIVISVTSDELGRYTTNMTTTDYFENGQLVIPRTERQGATYDDHHTAIQGVDRWIKSHATQSEPLIRREMPWREKEPSAKQKEIIERAIKQGYVQLPPDIALTSGQASNIIALYFEQKKR